MFEFDATGITPSAQGQGKLLPRRWFKFVVLDYTTNDGSKTYPMDGLTKEGKFPKVDVLTEVVDPDQEFNGARVFHTVTFLPATTNGKPTKGAGMAIHWLKTIGQPYEGKIKPNSKAWIGAEAMGYAIEDDYKGKIKNKWGEIKPILADPQAPLKKESDEDVPF